MIALSLYAGIGFGVACERLGILELGVENDIDVLATRRAAGMHTLWHDVWQGVSPDAGLAYDLLLAGPPCQSFSIVGRGNGRKDLDEVLSLIQWVAVGVAARRLRAMTASMDPRTPLVILPLYYALRDRPKAIVLEQVPPVLPVWEAYADVLRGAGYSVVTGVVHAEAYGVPQTRKRAVLLAHRDREIALPEPTHSRYHVRHPERLDEGVKPWVSMADALGWPDGVVGFPRRADGRDEGMQIDGTAYRARDLRETSRPSWAVTGKARSWKRWGFTNRPAPTVHGHGLISRGPTGTKQAVIAGLEAGTYIPRPPFTLETARKPGAQREDYISITDRYDIRAVNFEVHEALALQTLPVDLPLQGSRTTQFQIVGNAVPPTLAAHLISAVL